MIDIKLNENSLKQLQKQIEDYEKTIQSKLTEYVDKLLDKGIVVANQYANSSSTFGRYITFYKEIENIDFGVKGILYAEDTQKVTSQFMHGGQVVSVDVSPLLMVEFGSGPKAENPMNYPGVGQGTLNTYGHAFDSGWYFVDLNGDVHPASGYTPKAPMFHALDEMESDIAKISKEVFG